jgi:SulP family sulfate permease
MAAGSRLLDKVRGRHVRDDLTAGLVLGVESVPDGLASGVLAGVNPLAALYGYLFGMVGAAFVTSSTFMAVQATGAMALVVADTDLSSRPDPERALYTLAVLTGVIMMAAGLLKGGTLLRFVPTAVMTGFVTAVGVNIVLGQLGDFTGAELTGANRIGRTVDLLLHPGRIELGSLSVGVVTLVLIVVLQRTRLGALGLVAAMVVGSALGALVSWAFDAPVALVSDLAEIPNALPLPVLPSPGDLGYLLVPAVSLAFIGLVQGAAVSAGVPNPDGRVSDASRDFVGQGVGNIVAGVFRGMPVGGSMSASALVAASGARSRLALGFAGGVMALVILAFAGVVGRVAMPAIAALLMVVGAGAVKPAKVVSVVKTGSVQTTILAMTFVLTLVIPVQYAVLVGVALAILMHVVQQSNRVRLTRLEIDERGHLREIAPPATVPAREVLVLQPYGSLFFASAPVFRGLLPEVTAASQDAVVVLRLRGIDQIGLSLIDVLRRYATDLQARGGTLKLVLSERQVERQMDAEGLVDLVGRDNVYLGNEWLGATVRKAHDDAVRTLAAGEEEGRGAPDA